MGGWVGEELGEGNALGTHEELARHGKSAGEGGDARQPGVADAALDLDGCEGIAGEDLQEAPGFLHAFQEHAKEGALVLRFHAVRYDLLRTTSKYTLMRWPVNEGVGVGTPLSAALLPHSRRPLAL
jgi:hypothetical protein